MPTRYLICRSRHKSLIRKYLHLRNVRQESTRSRDTAIRPGNTLRERKNPPPALHPAAAWPRCQISDRLYRNRTNRWNG
jgi:hypothetical protein